MAHPFRFGLYADSTDSRESWIAQARCAEQAGYSTLLLGDHVSYGGFAPLLGLLSAADATTRLRFGCHVLGVDFRNPVMLAQEIVSFDLLSGGRLEFGAGTGWLNTDYAATGISFDAAGARVGRLAETVAIIKGLAGDQPLTFEGEHYRVCDAALYVKPVQQPHPPLYIGGGSKRVLSLAGREANIVGLNARITASGQLDGTSVGSDATLQKVGWVREAAGRRFQEIELNVIVNRIIVTDDRRRGVADLAAWIEGFPAEVVSGYDTRPETLLQSPHFLVGSVEQIIADIQERRERYGISYYSLFVEPDTRAHVDCIVEHLSGT